VLRNEFNIETREENAAEIIVRAKPEMESAPDIPAEMESAPDIPEKIIEEI